MFSFLKGFEIGCLIEQINCRLTLAYLIPSFDIPEWLSSETLGILMLILEQSLHNEIFNVQIVSTYSA